MRAAANKPNINIVAVNDPFIPVDYMEYVGYVHILKASLPKFLMENEN